MPRIKNENLEAESDSSYDYGDKGEQGTDPLGRDRRGDKGLAFNVHIY